MSGQTLDNLPALWSDYGFLNIGSTATDVSKIIFTLTTKQNSYKEETLSPSDIKTIEKSSWNKNEATKVVIHGYIEDGSGGLLSTTKKVIKAYQNAGRSENLVFIDWHNLGRQLDYYSSANNTHKVGKVVSEFLIMLRSSNYIPKMESVHIVGFSLGAHVAGIASYCISQAIGEKLGRISGLDPAGPGFYFASKDRRLDSSDALFVDIIHTNKGILPSFGLDKDIGHINFNPNGGKHQPGCSLAAMRETMGVCSHIKAPEYFARSITGTKYMSCPCLTYTLFQMGRCRCRNGPLMGEFVGQRFTGVYYISIPVGN